MITQSELKAMSNSELDAAYAAYFDAGKASQDMNDIADEIIYRQASVVGFVSGLFGNEQFPLFAARLHSSQIDNAQSSVQDSAAAVGKTLTFGASGVLIVAALVAIAFIIYRVKK